MRDGWAETTLGEVVSLVKGISYRSAELSENDGVPFLNLKNVSRGGGYRSSGLKWFTGEGRQNQRGNPGDLFIALTDLTRDMAVVGSPILIPPTDALIDSWFSLDLARLDLIQDRVALIPYLGLVLEAPSSRRFMKSVTTGTTVMHLNTKAALAMPFYLPPLTEQRRIVDLIASVDTAIEAAEEAISRLRSTGRAMRANVFGNTDSSRLADVVAVTMGRQRAPKYAAGVSPVPYLRAANVGAGALDLQDVLSMDFDSNEQAKYRLEAGDTLVTEGCGSIDQLGASSQWQGEIEGTVCFQNTLLRLRAIEGLSVPNYVYQWALYAFEAGEFARVASGTNIFHIGSTRATEMRAYFPSVQEQKEIATDLMAIDGAVAVATDQDETLKCLRVSLLSDLLSGNHEIPESYDRFLKAAS